MADQLDEGVIKKGDGYAVLDPETGEYLEIKGYGALKGMIEFDPRIDLTKPIYEQVLKLEKLDKAAARLKKSEKKLPVSA